MLARSTSPYDHILSSCESKPVFPPFLRERKAGFIIPQFFRRPYFLVTCGIGGWEWEIPYQRSLWGLVGWFLDAWTKEIGSYPRDGPPKMAFFQKQKKWPEKSLWIQIHNDVKFRVENFLMWVPSHLQRSSRNPSHININYSVANSRNRSPLGTCRVEGFFAWFLLRIGWGTLIIALDFLQTPLLWHAAGMEFGVSKLASERVFSRTKPKVYIIPGTHGWWIFSCKMYISLNSPSTASVGFGEVWPQVARIWTPSELVSVFSSWKHLIP